jgi:hypothetical protein
LRRGKAPDHVIDTAVESLRLKSDSLVLARTIATFLARQPAAAGA